MQRNKRILIVDDQPDLREQMAKLLQRAAKPKKSSLVQKMRERLLGGEDAKEDKSASEGKFSENEDVREDRTIYDEIYDVDTASQGEEAFEKIKKANEENKPYAVMFLDMRMPPGWDGLETAKHVREVDRNIEIVVMTAYADHDQKTIAQEVGRPEKLLYIKKPFQAEEIFQLALALTSKWNIEQMEKTRKEWLEDLIRCMSKIKSSINTRKGDIYETALKSIFAFTKATKGFISLWDQGEKDWNIAAALNLEKNEAEAFVKQHSEALSMCITTQSVEGKYFLPLKRNKFSAVVVLYDIITWDDPEWYKLLSLLGMTTSEVLSNVAITDGFLKKERFSAVGYVTSRIAHEVKNYLNNILNYATLLKDANLDAGLRNQYIENIFKIGDVVIHQMENISAYTKDQGDIKLVELDPETIIHTVCEIEKMRAEKHEKINFEYKFVRECPETFRIKGNSELLYSVFMNLIKNSVEAAIEKKMENLLISFTLKTEDNKCIIVYQDNGPGIPEEIKKNLFIPFFSSKESGRGLGLSIVKQILERHNADISYDENFTEGTRFIIAIPEAV